MGRASSLAAPPAPRRRRRQRRRAAEDAPPALDAWRADVAVAPALHDVEVELVDAEVAAIEAAPQDAAGRWLAPRERAARGAAAAARFRRRARERRQARAPPEWVGALAPSTCAASAAASRTRAATASRAGVPAGEYALCVGMCPKHG